jgi:hypothetical protein
MILIIHNPNSPKKLIISESLIAAISHDLKVAKVSPNIDLEKIGVIITRKDRSNYVTRLTDHP